MLLGTGMSEIPCLACYHQDKRKITDGWMDWCWKSLKELFIFSQGDRFTISERSMDLLPCDDSRNLKHSKDQWGEESSFRQGCWMQKRSKCNPDPAYISCELNLWWTSEIKSMYSRNKHKHAGPLQAVELITIFTGTNLILFKLRNMADSGHFTGNVWKKNPNISCFCHWTSHCVLHKRHFCLGIVSFSHSSEPQLYHCMRTMQLWQ